MILFLKKHRHKILNIKHKDYFSHLKDKLFQ